MSVANFIPELWSSRILSKLNDALVFGDVVNTDYEGEIRNGGDIVRINSVGPVTISPYVPGTTTITPETLDSEQQVLTIDQMRYFAFQVDDVDRAQASVNIMDEAITQAAWGLKNAADEYIAGLYSEASTITSGTAVTSTNVLACVLTLAQALDENNVPREGRWLVAPPWFITKLVLAKLTKENTTNDALNNGIVDRVAGFDVRVSNNVYNSSGTYYIMAGTKQAISFAGQLTKIETIRNTSAFADVVRGLYVYGAKVVQPDALAVLTATIGSES